MDRTTFVQKVMSKIALAPEEDKAKMDKNCEIFYKTEKCQNLIKEATELYPEYNCKGNHALSAVFHVMSEVDDQYKIGRLFDMIYAGLT